MSILDRSAFLFEKRMPYPRGRGLGGCSNSNWMQYNRGNPNDFDLWANLTGPMTNSFSRKKICFRFFSVIYNTKTLNSFQAILGGIIIAC